MSIPLNKQIGLIICSFEIKNKIADDKKAAIKYEDMFWQCNKTSYFNHFT